MFLYRTPKTPTYPTLTRCHAGPSIPPRFVTKDTREPPASRRADRSEDDIDSVPNHVRSAVTRMMIRLIRSKAKPDKSAMKSSENHPSKSGSLRMQMRRVLASSSPVSDLKVSFSSFAYRSDDGENVVSYVRASEMWPRIAARLDWAVDLSPFRPENACLLIKAAAGTDSMAASTTMTTATMMTTTATATRARRRVPPRCACLVNAQCRPNEARNGGAPRRATRVRESWRTALLSLSRTPRAASSDGTRPHPGSNFERGETTGFAVSSIEDYLCDILHHYKERWQNCIYVNYTSLYGNV